MKKFFCTLLLLPAALPALSACGSYDYSAHLSEVRSDVFTAQTEEFSLTLSCVTREYPYCSDGVAATKSALIEISLVSELPAAEYSVQLKESGVGGEMTFRGARGDYFFSAGVTQFPEERVTLLLRCDEEEREVQLRSVKGKDTLTCKQALSAAVNAERALIDRMTREGSFFGEFRVRLILRDIPYYYVGIVGEDGREHALLLDAKSGEVLARRAL